MTDDELERLLNKAAPKIGDARLERVARAIARGQERIEGQSEGWFGWMTARSGFAFAGLFLLGAVVNLLMRAMGPTPLDFLMSQSALLPWGG